MRIRDHEEFAENKKNNYNNLGDLTVSGEIPFGAMLILKSFVYFLLFVAAIYIVTNDYDLKPCRNIDLESQEGICVRSFAVGGTPKPNNTNDRILCIPVSDARCPCSALRDSGVLINPRDGEACTFNNLTSTATCLPYQQFRNVCEDRTSCPDVEIATLNIAFIVYAIVFVLMTIPTFFAGIGMCTFRARHPNEFFGPFTRYENCLILMLKSNRSFIQMMTVFHIVTLGFAYYAFSAMSRACGDAQTNENDDFQQDNDASDILVLGFLLCAFTGVLSTFCSCNVSVRGELTNQPNDEGRECGKTVSNYCCCKSFRGK